MPHFYYLADWRGIMRSLAASFLVPREHGAWSMLIEPLLAAVIVAREITWPLLPAAGAALGAFLIREPLVVLARQAWVWKQPHPETASARRWFLAEAALLAACGLWLAMILPWRLLTSLAAAAVLLTIVAVWMIVRNRRRSMILQMASAAGLSASALLAALAIEGRIAAWAWWLWALCSAHSIAAVVVVHARLEARVADRTRRPELERAAARLRRRVFLVPAALFAAAILVAVSGRYWLAAALAFSSVVHAVELRLLGDPANLQTPLRTIGFRTLAVSLLFTALVIAGLW
jgi:membrane protein implicated in regulation of membrane protease activity